MTLDQVTRADFSACVGQRFTIEYQGVIFPAELTSVTPLVICPKPVSPSPRESFSLLFHAPADCRLNQGICQVAHPALGALGIFLVTVGPDAKGMRLEAIFNFI